jgi:TRAP-type uncharacterized transport system fused permease subunit
MAEKDNMKVNTSPVADVETGTAEDVEAIMKKYDRESNTRIWEGAPKQVIRYLLAAFSLLMLYMNLFANWDERVRRSLFVGVVIILSFLIYPMKKGSTKKNSIPIYDIILMVLGAGAYFYFVINFKTIIGHATRISQTEVIVGVIGILILAETCRRVVGIPILCVATFFICYAFYNGLGQGREFAVVLKSVVYNLFYTTGGVIGTPIGVCSTYIALFILFGAFLEATGISEFFIQLANSLAGASTGGPAKVAVISSALCGMVSGSSVGNTVTTGSVTIPLMKKTGYQGEFAGAVEAASSTGGQIMPPIMGAAAFLMAEMVGVQYGEIAMRAIFPALLYFTGIFITPLKSSGMLSAFCSRFLSQSPLCSHENSTLLFRPQSSLRLISFPWIVSVWSETVPTMYERYGISLSNPEMTISPFSSYVSVCPSSSSVWTPAPKLL